MTGNVRIGPEIIKGLQEALAFERGDRRGVRVTRVPLSAWAAEARPAPRYTGRRIAALRTRLKLSQSVFARALNVSAETVRAWEQGKRRPAGAALRLLQVADRHPLVLLEHLRLRSA
jgi:putative transcriptional regulator